MSQQLKLIQAGSEYVLHMFLHPRLFLFTSPAAEIFPTPRLHPVPNMFLLLLLMQFAAFALIFHGFSHSVLMFWLFNLNLFLEITLKTIRRKQNKM